jgi:hypothetical protein
MSPRPLFLLTDFGAASHYAGILHGVIRTRLPPACIVDLAHDVPPGDVRAGGYVLEAALPFLPPDAVAVVVVDPGVGGARRVLALSTEGRHVIAPDNGVLTGLVSNGPHPLLSVNRPDLELRPRSATFHGRDVFAPIGAHLAAGGAFEALGDPVTDPVLRPGWFPECGAGEVRGEIIAIDRFGNGITNLAAAVVGPWGPGCVVEVSGRSLDRFGLTFADGERGQPLLYMGSSGHLEIGVRDGSGAANLGFVTGTPVRFRRA